MKLNKQYTLDVMVPIRDAVTELTLQAAIDAAKNGIPRAQIQALVSRTAYSAAARIAQNLPYVRTVYSTANWLVQKLPNVDQIAYKCAVNAAKVVYDSNYSDPAVQERIATALFLEMMKNAHSKDDVLTAISRPRDSYTAIQMFCREAAQAIFDNEVDVHSAVVSMFEVMKAYYQIVEQKCTDSSDFYDLAQMVVSEQAEKFCNELITHGGYTESAPDEERMELNAICDSILLKQLAITADKVHADCKGWSAAAHRASSLSILNKIYLMAWTLGKTISETSDSNKLIKRDINKTLQQAKVDTANTLAHLRSRRASFELPKQIQQAIRILDEIASVQPAGDAGYAEVRKFIEKYLHSDPEDFLAQVKQRDVRELVYTFVMNTAADIVESGKYHFYRGIVKPGPGQDLVRIFNWAQDELLNMGATDEVTVQKSKQAFQRNLAAVG